MPSYEWVGGRLISQFTFDTSFSMMHFCIQRGEVSKYNPILITPVGGQIYKFGVSYGGWVIWYLTWLLHWNCSYENCDSQIPNTYQPITEPMHSAEETLDQDHFSKEDPFFPFVDFQLKFINTSYIMFGFRKYHKIIKQLVLSILYSFFMNTLKQYSP